MFKITTEELLNWKSQFVTSKSDKMGLRKRPNLFTEQGVAMLSSVLNGETAIHVNIQIIRIFTRIKEFLSTHKDVLLKLEVLEKNLLHQNEKTNKHEAEIQIIFTTLKQFLNPIDLPRKRIGYKPESE